MKLRRLAATEGRVEVEVAALRKLYAADGAGAGPGYRARRRTPWRHAGRGDGGGGGAGAQHRGGQRAGGVRDGRRAVAGGQDCRAGHARPRRRRGARAGCVRPTPAGEPGLVPRARAPRRNSARLGALSVFERELGVVRETATEDKAELESQRCCSARWTTTPPRLWWRRRRCRRRWTSPWARWRARAR